MLLISRRHVQKYAWLVQGSAFSEIEPLGEEGQPARSALVQALQARIRSLEQELRESDNTHKLRCRFAGRAGLLNYFCNEVQQHV